MRASHLWDASTIAALDANTEKDQRENRRLNNASTPMRRHLGKLGAGH